LFSAEGMVIGVCNAAEPVDQEGLFAALGSIHAALDQQGLTSLYHQPLAGPTLIAATTSPATDPRNLAAATDPFAGRNREPPVRVPSPEPPAAVVAASTATASQNSPGNGPLPAGEQNVMDEIRRRVREGAEVVCIIRDRQDPQSKSEVITLNRASAGFVDQLSRAGESAGVPQPTSLEVPRRRMPILEWDVGAGYRHDHPLPR
jgi:hypothetical protein